MNDATKADRRNPLPDLQRIYDMATENLLDEAAHGCTPENCEFMRVNREIRALIQETRLLLENP